MQICSRLKKIRANLLHLVFVGMAFTFFTHQAVAQDAPSPLENNPEKSRTSEKKKKKKKAAQSSETSATGESASAGTAATTTAGPGNGTGSEPEAASDLVPIPTRSRLYPKDWMVRKVDIVGNVEAFNWPYTLEAFPDASKYIVLAIDVPKGTPIQTVSPGIWDTQKSVILALLSKRDAAINIETGGNAGAASQSSLVIQMVPEHTLTYVGDTCTQGGYEIRGPNRDVKEYLYLHFQCTAKGQATQFSVSLPPDEAQLIPGEGLKSFSSSSEAATFELTPPKLDSNASGDWVKVASFQIKSKLDPKLKDNYEIVYRPFGNKWTFGGALSLSYLHYSEPTQQTPLSIDTMALTAKVSVDRVLKPNKWHIGGNLWGSVIPIPLSKEPSTIPSTRFMGLSIRGLYWLPESFHPLEARWSISGGWYAWSMFGQDQYGVSLLSGPQVVLAALKPLPDNQSAFGYFKYAPISKGFGNISFSSYEIALGGGYTFRKNDYDWTVVLDLARVSASDSVNTLGLTTINAGLQIPIPFRKAHAGGATASTPSTQADATSSEPKKE